jgi:hypothetical protein
LEIFDKFGELTIYMITSSSTGTIYIVFEIKKHPVLLIPSHLNSFPIGYRIKRVYAPEGGKDESL